MTKRSINYLIPKLTVFSIPAVFGLSLVMPPALALGVWAVICLAFIVQNKIERRKEAAGLVTAKATGIPIMTVAESYREAAARPEDRRCCPHCGRPA